MGKNEEKKPEVKAAAVATPPQTTAVATTTQTAISKYEMPEEFDADKLTSDDLMIPRVKLLQGLSPEVSNGSGTIGDWFNDLSGLSYGREITSIIFLRIMKGWAIYGDKDTEDSGKMLARVFDNPGMPSFKPELICKPELDEKGKATGRWLNEPREDLLKWDDAKGIKPKAQKFFTYLVFINGDDFAYINLKGKALKEAKKINSLLKMKRDMKGEQYFENQYKVISRFIDEGPQKKYWAPVIMPNGKTPDNYKEICYKFISSMSGKKIKMYEGENGDAEMNAETADEKPF